MSSAKPGVKRMSVTSAFTTEADAQLASMMHIQACCRRFVVLARVKRAKRAQEVRSERCSRRCVNRVTFGAPGPDGSSCCISRNMSSIPVATRAAKRDIRRMHEQGLRNSPPRVCAAAEQSSTTRRSRRCESVEQV